MIETTDNSRVPWNFTDEEISDISNLANKSIADLLAGKNHKLLIFPNNISESKDKIAQEKIFTLDKEKEVLMTDNILGFIGINNTQISICSRFAKSSKKDFFLHYMLCKALSINVFNLEHSTAEDSILDFMLYFFINRFRDAMRQGIYKEYQRREYNDSNVRGTIDVNRHIKLNYPNTGKIAYHTREYCYDNHITQLVRHTIEFIKSNPFGSSILSYDEQVKSFVRQIMDATPSYNRSQRIFIMNQNIKPVHHPYFSKYTDLQKICMQILRHDKFKYGEEKDQIYGILFNGSWLWEEYVGIILKPILKHYRTGMKLFIDENGRKIQTIIPDFLSESYEDADKREIVADAKYMRLDKENNYGEDKANAVYYKTIMYMYRFSSQRGYLLYPLQTDDQNNDPNPKKDVLNIIGTNSRLIKYGMPIPQSIDMFSDFCKAMKERENNFLNNLQEH